MSRRARFSFGAILIIGLVLTVYRPLLPGSFIIDDLSLIKQKNPIVTGEMSPWTIWFQTDFTLSTFVLWLQWLAWGENPGGYHVVNLALHALSAILLWRLLKRLKIPGAWLVAAVFAVHPVCVNSVARIAEVKNTLSLPFFILSFWSYLRSSGHESPDKSGGPQDALVSKREPAIRRAIHYGFSLVAFILALLSKTTTVMLPFVLLGAVMWQTGRITRRDLVRTSPFFALSLAFGLMSIWFQKYQALASAGQILKPAGLLERLVIAGRGVWFYLGKAVCPLHLNVVYVRWNPETTRLTGFLPLLLLCAMLIVCWSFRRTWGRPFLFCLGGFLVTLFPALGFFDSQFLTMWQVSDHLQYLPLIAPLAFAIGGLSHLVKVLNCLSTFAESRASVLPLPRQRAGEGWANFARNGIQLNPGSFWFVSEFILAFILILPASILTQHRAHVFSTEESLFRDTLAKNPAASVVHNDFGVRLAKTGNQKEALAHFKTAVLSSPDDPGAQLNLAQALALLGNFAEAEPHFLAAIKIKPENALSHRSYASALARQGRTHDAIMQLTAALCFQPDVQTRLDLAGLFFRAGDSRRAAAQFRRVLTLKPNLPEPLSNLAWLLATCSDGTLRDGVQAVQHAERACQLTGFRHSITISTLAAAYAEAGRYPEAVRTAESALRMQTANGENALAALNQQLLSLYRAGKPYHQTSLP